MEHVFSSSILKGKTGLPFQNSTYSRELSSGITGPQRVISAPLRSTTWLEKPLGLFWLFRPCTADITIRYTTSSISFKHAVEKLELSWATVYTECCQNKGQKKTCRKKPIREKNLAGNLGRINGSCSEKPILRRLHGWKVFALIYKTSIPTKDGKL